MDLGTIQRRADKLDAELVSVVPRQVINHSIEWMRMLPSYRTVVVSTSVAEARQHQQTSVDTVAFIPVVYFRNHVHGVEDVALFYFHLSAHAICDDMWRRCSIPRTEFSAVELDFIDEVYNMRLLYDDVPTAHCGYNNKLPGYSMGVVGRYSESTAVQNSMLSNMVCDTLRIELTALHTWLYGVDPWSDANFSMYVMQWKKLLDTTDICIGSMFG